MTMNDNYRLHYANAKSRGSDAKFTIYKMMSEKQNTKIFKIQTFKILFCIEIITQFDKKPFG